MQIIRTVTESVYHSDTSLEDRVDKFKDIKYYIIEKESGIVLGVVNDSDSRYIDCIIVKNGYCFLGELMISKKNLNRLIENDLVDLTKESKYI